MCRVLRVKEGTYFAWRKRGQSRRHRENASLLMRIRETVASRNGTYGSRRVTRQLRQSGFGVNRKRVASIMNANAIRPYQRRARTSYPTPIASGENVLARRFSPSEPNEVWASDITNISTREGWLYLAVVLDLYSRRVVGWSMDRARRGQLTLDALTAAINLRRPRTFIHHSDRGTQYTSEEYLATILQNGGTLSLSRKGNCWDNAVVESFFATLKRELMQGKTFATRDEARSAIFRYIETWYNRRRLHSTLGYRSPADFEGKAA